MKTEQDKIKKIIREMTEEEYAENSVLLDEIQPFAAHENVQMDDKLRAVMTNKVKYLMQDIFDVMKLDFKNDPNLKDTPTRLASMWVNELMVGRYQNAPRIEAFPNNMTNSNITDIEFDYPDSGMIVAKKVDIRSLCSHHFMPFFDDGINSYAIIAYKPTTKLLGISKLQRLVHFYGRRPQLQEMLSYQIFSHIKEVIDSEDVMVSMQNITHTCETQRGVETACGATSTLHFGGIFNDSQLRREIILQAK